MMDRHVKEVLQNASRVDVAVVGIGTIDPSMSSLLRAGCLTPKELKDLAESGVVGDVCALMFDIEGNLLDVPLARRVVGVQADMQIGRAACREREDGAAVAGAGTQTSWETRW